MRKPILYITSSVEDYLADGLLHGLREILGEQIVDFPKAEHLYEEFTPYVNERIRGHGMTMYTCPLKNIDIDRSQIEVRLSNHDFSCVVFSCIGRQYGLFTQWLHHYQLTPVILVDGADSDLAVPHLKHRIKSLIFSAPTSRFLYFKREWTHKTHFNLLAAILTKLGLRVPSNYSNLRHIAFAIPPQKLRKETPIKTKLFPTHIIDPEIRDVLGIKGESYSFSTEEEYYKDLAQSRFGITNKRGGWDCLRHYEIVINQAVPCFRNLNHKDPNCAPHGMNEGNCVIYHSAEELLNICQSMSEECYKKLQSAGQDWLKKQTTIARAREFLTAIETV